VHKTLAIASSVLLTAGLLGLAGCSSSATACESLSTSGAQPKAVKVSGTFGAKPTVTFTPGITTSGTQSETVIAGTGAVVLPAQAVSIEAQIYDGKTGNLLQSTNYDGKTLATIPVDVTKLGGITKAIQCHKVGSRVVAVIGNDEVLANALGLSKNDTVVAVFDIVKAQSTKADGAPQVVEDGLPQVVLSPDGVPGITIPSTTAPTKLKVAVLKKGDGATVAAHANVTVQYVGVVWQKDAQPFDSSWSRGTPAEFSVDGVVPGFRDAIVGQKIGSQVLVIIPPDQGYGAAAQGAIPANSTLVFVIDILGVN
jgi:FKBP-type peptidyl-prolyl cis-trans isomerase